MRFRLRTLLIVMTGAALFFAGYRLGLEHSRGAFDILVQQIMTTLKPDSWDDVGGPGSLPLDDPGQVDPDDPFATPK